MLLEHYAFDMELTLPLLNFQELKHLQKMLKISGLEQRKKTIPLQQYNYLVLLRKVLQNFQINLNLLKVFLGFNLNLGCPDPQVVSLGYGCAMIKNFSKVKRMVDIIKNKGYSCSVKMRLGKNAKEKEKKFYLNTIKEVDADFFIVHPRHGQEGYDKKPDYSVLKECSKTGKIIIANGDIDSIEKVKMLKSYGVAGVMIGRAAVVRPQIFDKLKGNKLVSSEEIKKEYNELSREYNAPFRYRKNIMKRMLQIK
eukprot:TRINITY_DN3179_c0_g1_i2.p3 TRINITY_DN3179_c0_g1~~TRINITY_DN3179_c0_g1_i2.p3  ORF type:complete len:253 (+),score=34.85 TRINITY_DN3179_c0_g1_i2:673-1431(+)